MKNSYKWSFSTSPVRKTYWAYESAQFVRTLLELVVDEQDLPNELILRGWLSLDINSLVPSDPKRPHMSAIFQGHREIFDESASYEESLSRIERFILGIVKGLLQAPGLQGDITFTFGMFCPNVLLRADESVMLDVIRVRHGADIYYRAKPARSRFFKECI